LTKEESKSIISSAINYFDKFIEKGYLSIQSGNYSIDEVLTIIKDSFHEYGTFNEDGTYFEYTKDQANFVPIIVIDDASLITGSNSAGSIKNENAYKLGIELKKLSKILNAIIVMAVPSVNIYQAKRGKYFINKIDEVYPFSIYADKILFMHNPKETEDAFSIGYNMEDFIDKKTGACYFRQMNISANNLGPSGIIVPYFFFPQSGQMYELPHATDEEELNAFLALVSQQLVFSNENNQE